MTSMLELVDVSKRFGDLQALHKTSLTVEAGKTTVLLGPNGCGKSTVLRLVVGLIQSDTGRITFDGEEVNKDNILQIRHRVGYITQEQRF